MTDRERVVTGVLIVAIFVVVGFTLFSVVGNMQSATTDAGQNVSEWCAAHNGTLSTVQSNHGNTTSCELKNGTHVFVETPTQVA